MEIRFDHVSFKYGKKEKYALKDINLVLNESEIVFIMGCTGSGKSTLVQHLNGLLLCNEGKVKIEIGENKFVLNNDIKEKNLNKLRKEIGLVFQFPEYQLFETTVIKDVMFGPYNFFKDENKAREMAVKALNVVGISEEYYEKSPFDLSGGEKRKVAIAGVLASDPRVIILDEPTSSLDPVASKEMMELVTNLKEQGKLIIVISHDTDLCYAYGDRVIILDEGEILRDTRVCTAFDDKYVLDKAGLIEPFVYRVKRSIKNADEKIRNIADLKEVIKNG